MSDDNPYALTEPCNACPFLNTPNMKQGFTLRRLREFADNGEFHCHKTCGTTEDDDGFDEFTPIEGSKVCAGMLIFNVKRGSFNQMMRISGRLGLFDPSKLNMKANVR